MLPNTVYSEAEPEISLLWLATLKAEVHGYKLSLHILFLCLDLLLLIFKLNRKREGKISAL